jgi:arginine:ornithine antiporter / lysine permease
MASNQQLSLRALIALVVGSMIGSGIFTLPAKFGQATGGLGAAIAWCIAGGGMLMLTFVFQTLALRKPQLDAGIYAYAKAGFGDYLGFASALGYWAGCCLADVACLILIKSTLGAFFPIFGDGNTTMAILGGSALLWGVHVLVLRGIKEAASINTIATVAKIVPIVIFIGYAIWAFQLGVFQLNFWGVAEPNVRAISDQVRSTMLVTVFVFVGVEGASVYSRYAKKRSDVGVATVLGFLSVLCLLVLVTLLSFGVLPREELANLRNPSMAGVMQAIVGRWGTVFISVGLLISVLGNYLSWSLLAAEVLHSAAKNDTMPAFLASENANNSPAGALWLTNFVIQGFLIVSWFAEEAFLMALKMTSSMTLIPYLFVAAYGFKLAQSGETYDLKPENRTKDWMVSIVATLYAAAMIYAGGAKFVLLSALIYAPGTVLYWLARREQNLRLFTWLERLIFAVAVAAAIIALRGLMTGVITI